MTAKRENKIGIMGGTFDPIHYGHLVAAETARYKFGLNKVIFVPSGNPPHKTTKQISSPEDRFQMTLLATASNEFFEVSKEEVNRQGPSYTVDTMDRFAVLFPDAELYFITGADAIMEIMTWKDWHRLLAGYHFIAATRPGYKLSQVTDNLNNLPYLEKIYTLEIPGMAISSTELRQMVAFGQSIKYLLPEAVEAYIYAHNLYI